jgi:PEP-CTERM motif
LKKFTLATILLAAICTLVAVSAKADSLVYSNGDYNGTVEAWTINNGFQVSDSFTVSGDNPVWALHRVYMVLWLVDPADVLQQVDWEIGTTAGGAEIAFGTSRFTNQTLLSTNGYGYPVESADIAINASVGPGTYWLSLQNAVDDSGDPIYWDENDGPSAAWENTLGYLTGANGDCSNPGPTGYCSETFSIYGSSQTPEPGSLMLLGTGLIGVAGFFRRRLGL